MQNSYAPSIGESMARNLSWARVHRVPVVVILIDQISSIIIIRLHGN